ncbi:MAG: hypothetical protein AB7O73_08810, partial [Bacteroidia bacterium]
PISGNKKTRDKIILRELAFKQNDSIQLMQIPFLLERSEQNIFNSHLFIYDSIKPSINHDSKSLDVSIKVKERWYIWPYPYIDYLDRDFNNWIVNKDVKRLAPGINVQFDNFSGNKDVLTLQLQLGYANEYGFNYQLPYLNKKQTFGSYIQYFYSEYNKLHYKTENNKQLFLSSDSTHLKIDNSGALGCFYRPRLYIYHSLGYSYNIVNVSNAVTSNNENFFNEGKDKIKYSTLTYRFNFDNRDNKIYPLKGIYFDVSLAKIGLDLSRQSPVDNTISYLTFKTYFPISGKLNFATHWRYRNIKIAESQPFYFNRALGYSYFIRGYEKSIIDGQNYYFTRNSFRLQLIKPKFHEVDAIKKIQPFSTIPFYSYINLFFDGGYVKEDFYKTNNNLNNSIQYGYGIGIDFISYYDLVFRVELSRNKLNENGIFIHFTSGF